MVLSLRLTPGENLSNTLVNGGTEKVKTTDTEQKMGRGGRMQKMGRDEMDQYSLFMHFMHGRRHKLQPSCKRQARGGILICLS